MIEKLTVVVPKHIVDRSTMDQERVRAFEAVTGIKKTRRWMNGGTHSFLEAAINAARINTRGVARLIVVTQSPDRFSPCTAIEAHRFLRLESHVPCFDMNNACGGFVMGLDVASMWTACDNTILICVDMLRYGEGTDSLIFSDAVSICEINSSPHTLTMPIHFTDPSGAGKLYAGVDGKMMMDASSTFDFVVHNVPKLIKQYSTFPEDPDRYLCGHQSNLSMMRLIEKKSGYLGRSLRSIQEYGNQSMCSIPTALAYNEEEILGKFVLLCGYGAGFSASLGLTRWPKHKISKIIEV